MAAQTRTRSGLTPNRADSLLLIVVLSTPWRVAAAVSDNPARSRIRRSSVPSRRLRSVGGFLALTPDRPLPAGTA
ncbi:hypothetical protein GCM10023329_16990 [Streptomyces sanyensis]|uniref:Secreted protein n=1 Tax=Streptomyces sanyensis TaxID=568869 RepID=A0ABP9A018_9ACTN